MSEDNYVEWLVKRKTPAYAVPAMAGMAAVCVLALFLSMQTMFGMIGLLLAIGATYFVYLSLHVEYEYLLAEGSLSVDRILGKAKRKKIFECEKDGIRIVAPADSYVLKDYEKQGMKIRDFTSGGKNGKVYAIICQIGPENFKVLIEPNEKMLGAMRRSFPGKLVRQ